MCDPVTMLTAAASAASTLIGVGQQLQHAQGQRNDYNYLAAQQRNAAAVDEARARQIEQAGEADAVQARENAARKLGQHQARLAAQGTDLSAPRSTCSATRRQPVRKTRSRCATAPCATRGKTAYEAAAGGPTRATTRQQRASSTHHPES